MIKKFSKDHEWAEINGDIATVGITDYAAEQLGDVVYAETPEVGRQVTKGDSVAVVESVKAASEVYTPISGEVVESNAALGSSPELINSDPFGKGWFFKVRIKNTGELDALMDEAAYKDFIKGH